MRNYRADQFRRPSVISKSMQMTVFIAPLFNKFRPLEDPELRSRIEALLARNGFSITDFLVMDGSLRSTHGNAYFTGFGKNRRVVFFDTLLTDLKPAEIESVLVAYELGHFKCTHVLLQSLPGVAGVWPRATAGVNAQIQNQGPTELITRAASPDDTHGETKPTHQESNAPYRSDQPDAT